MSLPASLQKIEQRIFQKGEHQAAAAYLGQLAFSASAAASYAAQAAASITQVLRVEYSIFWELDEDQQSLMLMAASGEIESSFLPSSFSLYPNSLEEATLASDEPVTFENSRYEIALRLLDPIAAQQVEKGISVRIGTLEKPYGILQVFSIQEKSFSQQDAYFLQSIANLIGLVLHQGLCRQEQTPNAGVPATKTKPIFQSGGLEWDLYEIKNRLVESDERERLRLAQELHDAPIQDLYGMIYQLDDLRDVIKDPEGEKIMDECDHTLHRVVNSLRSICRELRPPSLSPFGLEVAIRDHVEKFREQNSELQVHLDLMQDKQVLSDSMRLILFRIYQQALHNVVQHAQASDVHIRFRWDEKTVILEVEDNGIGFEMPQNWMELVREEHFGLLGIAERIEGIQGKLEIVSALGNGTLVRAIAPYSKPTIG